MRRAAVTAAAANNLGDFTIQKLGSGTREAPVSGEPLKLDQFKGKVVLIENVATL
jgi:hypothetical protein